jgi:hypothetical protein
MSTHDLLQSFNDTVRKFLDDFVDLSKQRIDVAIDAKLEPIEKKLLEISILLDTVNTKLTDLQQTVKPLEPDSERINNQNFEPLRYESIIGLEAPQERLKDSYLATIRGALLDRGQFKFASIDKQQSYFKALALFDQSFKDKERTPFPQPYHGLSIHLLACMFEPNQYPQDKIYKTHQTRYHSVLDTIDRNRKDQITKLDFATLYEKFKSLDALCGLDSEWHILQKFFSESLEEREKQQIQPAKTRGNSR